MQACLATSTTNRAGDAAGMETGDGYPLAGDDSPYRVCQDGPRRKAGVVPKKKAERFRPAPKLRHREFVAN